jgi:hypothetical protein
MGLQLPFGIDPTNPISVDQRYGPWASLAAAKAGVVSALRFNGLTANIIGLGEHWWTTDLSDSGLVPKSGGASLPIVHYVYLVADSSDATLMGGTSSNVYTTFQTAWDAAVAIATLNPSYQVLIKVGVITAAQSGNVTATGAALNVSDRIFFEGTGTNSSILGNFSSSAGFGLYLHMSNIKIGNITITSSSYLFIYYCNNVEILNVISCFSIYAISSNNIKIIGSTTLVGGAPTFSSSILVYGCSYIKLGDISGTDISFDLGTPINGLNWNAHYSPIIVSSISVTNSRQFPLTFRGVTITGNLSITSTFVSSSGIITFVFENIKVYGTTTINRSGTVLYTTIRGCCFEDLILTGSTFTALGINNCSIRKVTALPANTTVINSSIFAQDMRGFTGSNNLVTGQNYKIVTYVAGDDFTNVGAASNATGVIFTSTGTIPTTWIFGSVLQIYEVINGIGSGCEFYNSSVVGGTLSIDNGIAVSVKFTSGLSSYKTDPGLNVTLT